MWYKIFETLPSILTAIVIMLIGWIVARSLSYLVFKGIQLSKLENLASKAIGKNITQQEDSKWSLAIVLKKIVYYTVLLLFAVFASEVLGWQVVTQELSKLIAYLPKLFSAVIIFLIGLYIAGFIRKALHMGTASFNIQGSSIISTLVFYVLMTLITVTALSQAGIDTGAVTANFLIIIGSIFLSFAVAFGLGARDLLRNMVAGLYARRSFYVGQHILIDGMEGNIEQINTINFILGMKDMKVSIPIAKLLDEKVVIYNDPTAESDNL